ncbi:MAG: porin family protein [Alphaproteobacteria bacterium]|nr:MAG: porin family protein [Alphaproteobacteria bacterium]
MEGIMRSSILAIAVAMSMSPPSLAADFLTAPETVAYASETTDWTGPYIGVSVGITAGNNTGELGPTGGPPAFEMLSHSSGFIGGIQAGYDHQISDQFVVGIVGDISGSTHQSMLTFQPPGGPPAFDLGSRLDYVASLRVKAGVTFDSLLAYVHGGVAHGHVTPSFSAGGVPAPGLVAGGRTGFVVGAGVQHRVTENLSLQAEYSYTDLGWGTTLDDGFVLARDHMRFSAIKIGANWHF